MAGKRYSQQRDMIYRFVASTDTHPTADMVYRSLKQEVPTLSLGTVYRNLNLLCDEGELKRLPFDVDRYDASVNPHAHLECTACGGVFDLKGDIAPVCSTYSQSNPDCRLSFGALVFRGLCAGCKNAQGAEKKC